MFYILSYLSDNLYKTQIKYKTTKEIWNALEDTYLKKLEGVIRFTTFDFNLYIMVDHLPIND